ncbi:hypothetical protein EFB08_05290 [Rufibacter latericius]|uniref:Uncharacterized protein n=1 Tax=Rufibacter latericius TaxID=2487040 RepID=A0A3M9N0K1_9BACT|nr:hypothetical protein EFB08_05290 [Rufibacter latericius]
MPHFYFFAPQPQVEAKIIYISMSCTTTAVFSPVLENQCLFSKLDIPFRKKAVDKKRPHTLSTFRFPFPKVKKVHG